MKAGYECTFGDFMFSLGMPIPLHRETAQSVGFLALAAGRATAVEWFYPTGEKQEQRKPKYPKWFHWATVIAGDCHYIKR